MTATVGDIIGIMERFAPLELAEAWDNSGLQVGHVDWPVKNIMVALDPTPDVLNSAIEDSANLLITHHPLIFSPIKSIDLGTPLGGMIASAIRNHMAVFSAHTNFDSALEGLNDILAARIGLKNLSVLESRGLQPASLDENLNGLGRIGDLGRQSDLASLCRMLKQALHIETVRMIGPPELPINRVAICTGSGASLMAHFLSSDAQVFITGDIRYHDARKAEESGMALIDIGHFGSEHIMVKALVDRLTGSLAKLHQDVSVHACEVERDPFTTL